MYFDALWLPFYSFHLAVVFVSEDLVWIFFPSEAAIYGFWNVIYTRAGYRRNCFDFRLWFSSRRNVSTAANGASGWIAWLHCRWSRMNRIQWAAHELDPFRPKIEDHSTYVAFCIVFTAIVLCSVCSQRSRWEQQIRRKIKCYTWLSGERSACMHLCTMHHSGSNGCSIRVHSHKFGITGDCNNMRNEMERERIKKKDTRKENLVARFFF